MAHDELIQEAAKFLKFRTAASFGRGFMTRAVPSLRRTRRQAKVFFGGMKQHMDAKDARKLKRSLAYQAFWPTGKGLINKMVAKGDKGRGRMIRMGGKLAPKVGAGILLGAGALKGARVYSNWRKKAQQQTQYRNLAVYPQHGHAAVGIQPYNQPYYNEPERSGPPSYERARIGGMYERAELVDRIVEACSK